MNFSQTCSISASRQKVWDFLMDMANVSRCLPGVESMEQLKEDTYQGVYKVKVGPIALKFQGILQFEVRDREQWHAGMHAEAKDRRLGGGIRARLDVDLMEQGPDQTEMQVNLESYVLGKVGEFGQPVMRKKTNAILQKFARRVSEALAGE